MLYTLLDLRLPEHTYKQFSLLPNPNHTSSNEFLDLSTDTRVLHVLRESLRVTYYTISIFRLEGSIAGVRLAFRLLQD